MRYYAVPGHCPVTVTVPDNHESQRRRTPPHATVTVKYKDIEPLG